MSQYEIIVTFNRPTGTFSVTGIKNVDPVTFRELGPLFEMLGYTHATNSELKGSGSGNLPMNDSMSIQMSHGELGYRVVVTILAEESPNQVTPTA